MACDRIRALLPLLVDGALHQPRRFLVNRHVAGCPSCTSHLEELQSIQAMIRTKLPFHRAPPGLAARIGATLPREAPPLPGRRWFRLPAFGIAGGGIAGALAGVALTLVLLQGPAREDVAVKSVIGSHIRSLMAEHLTDVATSDQHTVKPWLSARLDVSPPVRDMADLGFPLLGGRLDYVDGHKGGAVVYRHAKHIINLLAWAAPGHDAGFAEQTHQGFNVVSWRRDGVAYYAVSDLNANELAAFARLVGG
jgi:anti-sigma factor RsiW